MRRSMLGLVCLSSLLLVGFDGGCEDCVPPPTPGGGGVTPEVFLSDKAAKSLSFEIDYVTGREPNQAALDGFEAKLETLRAGGYMKKPEGIVFQHDDALPPHAESGHAYTEQEVFELVARHRNTLSTGTQAWIYILYLDGHDVDDDSDSSTLGYAWGGDRIVMFADTIRKSCGAGWHPRKERVCAVGEASVLVHEVGHLLGLVNNGAPMQTPHQDVAHGRHDNNEQCIMYWTVNTSLQIKKLADLLDGGAIPDFDANCLADMRAVAER